MIIAELDNIEEITINTGGGADTVTPIGNYNPTSLAFNTITVNGGLGSDTVDVSQLTSDHRVVLNSGGGTDAIVGARSQDVVNHDDTLTGTALADTLDAGAGSDIVDALGGNDIVTGGAGHDIVIGGAGTDTAVYSGPVGDYSFSLSGSNLVVSSTADGTDLLNSVEKLRFGADTLELNVGTNANNAINAGAGNDLVLGFDGNDTLTGGVGVDTLIGGAGNDAYVFDDGHTGKGVQRDTIIGFSSGDTINLAAIDANTTMGGTVVRVFSFANIYTTTNSAAVSESSNGQAFTFIGTDAFSDTNTGSGLAQGQIRYQLFNSDGVGGDNSILIQGNVNNDLTADIEILLKNYTGPVTPSVFIF